jgi:transposase
MERAVVRGRRAKPSAVPALLGVDEKAIARGQRYMTLVCDLEQGTVEYIGQDRRQASLEAYFDAFEAQARQSAQAISLDMWPAYINACRAKIEEAERKMVLDRFHIMCHVIDAVASLKTARAWAIKEALRGLWEHPHEFAAEPFCRRRYFWATHSRLTPIVDAAKMIARHLVDVMTSFRHRITNAMAEGLNSRIATIRKRARGFRNTDHFKIAVYSHCGGLDLWPRRATHWKAG